MANETTQAQIDELGAVATAEAMLMIGKSTPLQTLVTRRNLSPGQISVRFPKWGTLTAAALTDGNELANQAMSTTGVVLTPAVNAGAAATITDLADWTNALQTAIDFGRQAGLAIQKKLNADIFGLFAGFSTALGASNTDITEALIRQGVKKLAQADAIGEIFLVMTPEVVEDFFTVYSTNTNNTSDRLRDAVMNGEMPTVYGVKPFMVNGPSEATDVVCGMFTREAIGYAVAWEAKVEAIRKPRAVGFEIASSSAYAVGEINDACGVALTVDGAD